jgi:hypothetical protein
MCRARYRPPDGAWSHRAERAVPQKEEEVASTSVTIVKYAVALWSWGWAVNLNDDTRNVGRLLFRTNGTIDSPTVAPSSTTWPSSGLFHAGVPVDLLPSVVDMLRNEKPVRLWIDVAKSPIEWHLDAGLEPVGEGEPV